MTKKKINEPTLTRDKIFTTLLDHPDGNYTLTEISDWIAGKFPGLVFNRRHLAALLNMMGFGKVPLSYYEIDQTSGRLYHCRAHHNTSGTVGTY